MLPILIPQLQTQINQRQVFEEISELERNYCFKETQNKCLHEKQESLTSSNNNYHELLELLKSKKNIQ
jgi:hypothetical protein